MLLLLVDSVAAEVCHLVHLKYACGVIHKGLRILEAGGKLDLASRNGVQIVDAWLGANFLAWRLTLGRKS